MLKRSHGRSSGYGCSRGGGGFAERHGALSFAIIQFEPKKPGFDQFDQQEIDDDGS